jgi:hypothetical protein
VLTGRPITVVAIVVFLVFVAVMGGLLYLLVIQREVPGAVEQRFGKLEALPSDVGKWKVDSESDEGRAAVKQGLKREVRLFHDVQSGKLTRQARYRNPATNEITRTEPDVPVPRRRVKS